MTTADKWRAVQSRLGLSADGIPGPRTAEAVAAALKIGWAFRKPAGDQEACEELGAEPKWLKVARSYIGTREINGPRHNPAILKWWEAIKANYRDDETPWCAAFVGGVLEECGIESSRSAAARSFMSWGQSCAPRQGAIVVFWRGSPSGWSGHVGFCVGISPDGDPWVLGGNQSDAVNIKKFSRSRVLGYRWPKNGPDPNRFPARHTNAKGDYSQNEA